MSLYTLPAMAASSNDTVCSAREYEMGIKYQQQSAEIAALQHQSYTIATQRLAEILRSYHGKQPLAIMTDLDETVLDNTAYAVQTMDHCASFNLKTWGNWERHGQPRLIPGALAFFNYAHQHGVTIFYVSDRSVANKSDTMAEMKKLGLPQVESQYVRLLGPSKEVRREAIRKHYNLVLQLGDTLADFAPGYKGSSLKTEHQLVEQNQAHFGRDWIVLPNASYGNWTSAKLTP